MQRFQRCLHLSTANGTQIRDSTLLVQGRPMPGRAASAAVTTTVAEQAKLAAGDVQASASTVRYAMFLMGEYDKCCDTAAAAASEARRGSR